MITTTWADLVNDKRSAGMSHAGLVRWAQMHCDPSLDVPHDAFVEGLAMLSEAWDLQPVEDS